MTCAESLVSRLHAIAAILFALAFAFARPALAFVGPPYLTPAQPTADDVIELSMFKDNCELIDGGFPAPPVVTEQGSKITILLTGAHEDEPLFCIYGIGVETNTVGRFPPGSYTLDVERRYTIFGGWVQETLGVIPFTVAPVSSPLPPSEAPTLSTGFLFILILATTGLATQRLHSHRRESSRSIR
jgi:hypothetical protein